MVGVAVWQLNDLSLIPLGTNFLEFSQTSTSFIKIYVLVGLIFFYYLLDVILTPLPVFYVGC